ncbi:hypothetical protein QEZ54_06525 [Catellatospora sp. KI3]|uniref:hypothetical protein n=1 Tax=Catellatospora sp. KI3 TaxID=3041620 RepID=UPI002482A08A|nr:hypothetical protein [Catellatospora sp. KI3]MDI1460613.1 hypothetical protein [Catellatospora sp. KI3]
MTVPTTPEAYVTRLRAVNWSDETMYARRRSRQVLMQEHLRRSAQWADLLQTDAWPFPDLAAAVDPTIQADPALVSEVEELIGGSVAEYVCLYALRWYTLRALPEVVLPDLPDPYEPLLAFFERGGDFTLITGHVDVGLALVPRWDVSRYLAAEPEADLDPATLDKLDGL